MRLIQGHTYGHRNTHHKSSTRNNALDRIQSVRNDLRLYDNLSHYERIFQGFRVFCLFCF